MRAEFPESGPAVAVEAMVEHLGGADVFYPSGCTAECYPLFHPPIRIDVFDPSGRRVFLETPCGSPYYCAELRLRLQAGEALRHRESLSDHT